MNTYSRALRHIDIKDVKQKHQQKLIEQKNKEEKKKEEEKYIVSVMEEKKYDWRRKLNEQMTSSGTFFTTLPATGDLQYSISDETLDIVSDGYDVTFDSSNIDTFVIDIVLSGGETATVSSGNNSIHITSSGTYELSISQSKALTVQFRFAGVGTSNVQDVSGKRKTPLNVFVSLDSPEASSFVRTDPNLSNLSPQERQQKLKEMLEASDEYVMKILGSDFPGTGSVPPGEYDPFAQAPPGQFGDTPGVEIAGGYGLRPDGTSGMNKVGDKVYDPATKKEYELVPSPKYGGGTQWTPVRQATKASMPMVASYEPEGKLISEKKKKYNWREELQKDKKKYFVEGMTTSDVFYTNLSSEGNVDLVSSDVSINFSGGTPGEIGSPSEGFYARTQIIGPVDTTRYDTIGITVTVNSSINYGEGLVLTSVGGLSGATLILSPGSTSGTYYARLPFTSSASSYRLIQLVSNTGSSTFTINKISYQRRSPKNVVLPLDSPEATAFIRTEPNLSNLSPQERLEKLKEMLKSSDEYVMKALGLDFPGTGAVPPGEYDPFAQAPPGEAGDTPGVDIAQLYPADYDRERAIDQMLLKGLQRGDYGTGPDIDRQIRQLQQNLQKGTPGGLPQASSGQDTQIAQIRPAQQQRGATGVGVPDTTGTSPGSNLPPPSQMNYPKEWLPKQARQGKMPMVASYELQGQLISEKRKLMSPQEILNKIPGYYDGKPAPLGFPETPPPEMVNGMHPDLVDGKKVADRFNRLDPESAKATPLTGNPHIDKKIKSARKQPK